MNPSNWTGLYGAGDEPPADPIRYLAAGVLARWKADLDGFGRDVGPSDSRHHKHWSELTYATDPAARDACACLDDDDSMVAWWCEVARVPVRWVWAEAKARMRDAEMVG